ncbi:MAG: hypothetical protein ACPGJE_01355, partial [Wenzhouxiangellaceae bacterium]
MKLNIFLTSLIQRSSACDQPSVARSASAAMVFSVLVCAFGSVAAQPKIILQTLPDPTEIPLAASSNVIIDPLSGDITAIPADTAACSGTGSGDCDAQVSTIAFNINPSTIQQGQAFTATFSQRGAWECSRSGLTGTSWNTTGFIAPFTQVTTLVGTAVTPGDYTLVYTCRNGIASPDALDTLSRVLTVQEASGGGGTPQECIDN